MLALLAWLDVLRHDVCVKQDRRGEPSLMPHHYFISCGEYITTVAFLRIRPSFDQLHPSHCILLAGFFRKGGIYSSDGSVWKSAACWNYSPSSWADHRAVLLLLRLSSGNTTTLFMSSNLMTPIMTHKNKRVRNLCAMCFLVIKAFCLNFWSTKCPIW